MTGDGTNPVVVDPDEAPSEIAVRARAARLGTAVAWAYEVLVRESSNPGESNGQVMGSSMGFVLVSLAMHCDLVGSRTTPVPPEAVARLSGLSPQRVREQLKRWTGTGLVEAGDMGARRAHYRLCPRGVRFGRSAIVPSSPSEERIPPDG